ncbi:YtxH domain-containing protein [Planotetraspora sp. A-T 1434]|uniref:YtxH domain-containing protein n=1 Tax=Planotetraspora sp. A-T 1434 TaxID=2979219 RepID=UPI0021BF3975|nr:YtxH domain-containing protein [Planotetraspora sp. A-T 1434]MCT9933646.1 YtxH domain-containing protein [Planotetraspora sp. A-T 1434]
MRYKAMFAAGLAVGYVLGTRAGRERYEQIKRMAQRVADSPSVQEAAGLVGAQASKVAEKAKDLAGDKFGGKVPFLKRQEPWQAEKVGAATGWPASDADRIT